MGVNVIYKPLCIHRDLKSKNVVISSDYTLKLCDFGASRFLAETATMTLVGTYPWMAPELIQGKPTSETCDTYSFGVVLWELICQDVPFRGMEGFQVAWAVVEKRQRPPLPSGLPREMTTIIEKCWNHNSKERPTMKEIMNITITCSSTTRNNNCFIDNPIVLSRASSERLALKETLA